MKKLFTLTLLGCIGLALQLKAQTDACDATVNSLISKNAAALHLSTDDLRNTRVSDAYYNSSTKILMVYLQQTYKGIDVANAITPVAFKGNQLVSLKSGRLSNIEDLLTGDKSEKPAIAAAAALRSAAASLSLALNSRALLPVKISPDKQEFEFDKSGIAFNNIIVRLLWASVGDNNKMQLAWQVNIQTVKGNNNWLVKVDAKNGAVLQKDNLTVNCVWDKPANAKPIASVKQIHKADGQWGTESANAINSANYNVIPYPFIDPDHVSPTLTANPWEVFGTGNNATTLKWNNDGAKDYDSTRGNNVYAQPDLDGKNPTQSGAARSGTSLPNLNFIFTPDFNTDPLKSSNNINFALTNLFYWNNLMHDMSYQYGFDELAGNYQQNNLSRGGKGNDYVIADGLDASGTNNANFATPIKDGNKPRMQMFLFTPSPLKIKLLIINAPASYAGPKMSSENTFSKNNKLSAKGPVTANVVFYKDQGATSHLACVVASNKTQLKNKIAYIDRGDCNFTAKVKNAQTAGAKGVIIGDNIDSDFPQTFGGTDNTITIPTVTITKKDADSLKNFLNSNIVVNATLKADTTAPHLDGDLDNSIVSHEYTHGISGRLTGGPNKSTLCLQNKEQMGEGWSDYVALMMTTDWTTAQSTDGASARPLGNYVLGLPSNYGGIRIYPYSTDKAINPWTYDSLATSSLMNEVHNIGEPWCEVLWDMTWALINSEGINRNFFDASQTGGNSTAMKLVMQGLKLQSCSIGYVSARNAILSADTLLFGGMHSGVLWQSFANRGLGYSAKEGKLTTVKDDTAAYDLPPSSLLTNNTSIKANSMKGVTDDASQKLITISPNPVRNMLTVNIASNTKTLQVKLFAAAGQQIAAYSVTGTSKNINVNSLTRGVYYVTVIGEGINYKEKVIVQ